MATNLLASLDSLASSAKQFVAADPSAKFRDSKSAEETITDQKMAMSDHSSVFTIHASEIGKLQRKEEFYAKGFESPEDYTARASAILERGAIIGDDSEVTGGDSGTYTLGEVVGAAIPRQFKNLSQPLHPGAPPVSLLTVRAENSRSTTGVHRAAARLPSLRRASSFCCYCASASPRCALLARCR
jgi:hypothetical protein